MYHSADALLLLFVCLLLLASSVFQWGVGGVFIFHYFISLFEGVFIPLFVISVCLCARILAVTLAQSGRKPGAFCTVSNQNWSFSLAGKQA